MDLQMSTDLYCCLLFLMFVVTYGTHGKLRDTLAVDAAEDLLRPSVLASRPKERQRDVRNQVGGATATGQGELVELMEI